MGRFPEKREAPPFALPSLFAVEAKDTRQKMATCHSSSPLFETDAEWEAYAALPPDERTVHTGALSKMMGTVSMSCSPRATAWHSC